MTAEDLYAMYAVKVALAAEAERDAKPKPILVAVAEPPEPALTRDCFDPIPTLH